MKWVPVRRGRNQVQACTRGYSLAAQLEVGVHLPDRYLGRSVETQQLLYSGGCNVRLGAQQVEWVGVAQEIPHADGDQFGCGPPAGERHVGQHGDEFILGDGVTDQATGQHQADQISSRLSATTLDQLSQVVEQV